MGKHNADAQSSNQPRDRRRARSSDRISFQDYSSETSLVSNSVTSGPRPPLPFDSLVYPPYPALFYNPASGYHPYPIPPSHLRPRHLASNPLLSEYPESTTSPSSDPPMYHTSPNPTSYLQPWSLIPRDLSSSSPSPSRGPTVRPFRPGSPTKEYNQTVARNTKRSDEPHAMLLVLDLNGTLLHRKRQGGHFNITPRPHLESFLDWSFKRRNRLKVMIWSSAQPENVRLMAQKCFKRHFGSIYEIWDRDTLGLTKAEYHQKVQTVKNLDLVWRELTHFSAEDTILVDDSPLKAHMQPYNHLIVHEYEPKRPETPELDSDETLLAVVGILSEAIRQTNVASWFRSGGLLSPPPTHKDPVIFQSEEIATSDDEWNGLDLSSADIDMSLETMWFDRPVIFNRWVKIGLRQLEAEEIPIAARSVDEPAKVDRLASARRPIHEPLAQVDRLPTQLDYSPDHQA